MRAMTLSLSLSVAAAVAWGQPVQRQLAHPPVVRLGAEEARIPMAFHGGRPVVEARVNGKGPYRFYLDTGASGPVVSQKLAGELSLEVLGSAAVKSGGDAEDKQPIPAQLVRIDRLELGSASLTDVRIVAMDRARLGGREAPVGVLSPAMFPGFLVTLDYPKREVRIRAGELGAADDKTVFAYQDGRPIPSVLATVGGQTIEAHLDSGSGAGLALPTKVAEQLALEGKPVDTGKRARSVRGDFPVFEGKLKGKLSFGRFSFDDPTIEFSDVVRRGNLGSRILNRFALTLDVKNRRFQMTCGE
jgi:hypothetical protein